MPYTYQYPHMAVTVDLVLFDCSKPEPSILLIKRGKEPFKDLWALPGGYVGMNERIEAAARRELSEETGAKVESLDVRRPEINHQFQNFWYTLYDG